MKPTASFDLYRLNPGERRQSGSLEIFYSGRAHTPDNVVVWVPAAELLAGGCAVRAAVSGGLGNLSDASVADWAESLRRVRTAYPSVKKILPGHGDLGGPELLQHTIDLAESALKPRAVNLPSAARN